MMLTKDNIKFTMFSDSGRWIVCESTYEIQKYYVLQLVNQSTGFGENLSVTLYTAVNVNVGTASFARGQRGIETDTKEFLALKYVVHSNIFNPFSKKLGEDEINHTQINFEQPASQYRFSLFKKKDLCVMVQQKDLGLGTSMMLDQSVLNDKTFLAPSSRNLY